MSERHRSRSSARIPGSYGAPRPAPRQNSLTARPPPLLGITPAGQTCTTRAPTPGCPRNGILSMQHNTSHRQPHGSAAAAHRPTLQDRLRRLWGFVCLSDGYLATVPTRTLLEKGLGKRAASNHVARARSSERDLGETLEDFLSGAEAHAATLGGRYRDRLYDQAVRGVVQRTRLEMEQENLLIPLEIQTSP